MKMNQKLWKALSAGLLISMSVFQTSCEKPDNSPLAEVASSEEMNSHSSHKTTTFYGPAQPLGQGVARAWVEMTRSGIPVAVGFSMSSKAANSLPNEGKMYELKFPKQASSTLYKSIGLDWGPGGHPPAIYQHPHFDMHFYMIADAQRRSIPHVSSHPHSTTFETDYMPANYFSTMEAIPAMGVHWIDATSPEFEPGGTFTKTFIIGAYNDEVIFHEPMITLAYLRSLSPNTIVETPIPQPARVQTTGYYPTKYTITYDPTPGQYIVALTGFVYRIAS